MHRNNRHQQPKKKQNKVPKQYVPFASVYEQIQPSLNNTSVVPVDLSSDYLSILEQMSSEDIIKSLKNPSTKPSEARMLFERLKPHQRRALLEERALEEFSANTPSSMTSDGGLPGNAWFPVIGRAPLFPGPASKPISITIGASGSEDFAFEGINLIINSYPPDYYAPYGTVVGSGEEWVIVDVPLITNYDNNTGTWGITGFESFTKLPAYFWISTPTSYNDGVPPPGTIYQPVPDSLITTALSTKPTGYTYYSNNIYSYGTFSNSQSSVATPLPTEYVILDNNLYFNRNSTFLQTITSVVISSPITYNGPVTNVMLDYFPNLQNITINKNVSLSPFSINSTSLRRLSMIDLKNTAISPTLPQPTPLQTVDINAPSIELLDLSLASWNRIDRLNVAYSSRLSSINTGITYDSVGCANLLINSDNTNLSGGVFSSSLQPNGYNWFSPLSANIISLSNKNWSFSTTISAYQFPTTYTPSRSACDKLIVLGPGTYNTTGTFLSGEYTRTGSIINNLDVWANSNNSYIWFNSAARTWQVTNPSTTGTVYLSTTVTNSNLINTPPTQRWSGLAYNSNSSVGGANYFAETQIIPSDCLQFKSYNYIANGANPIYRFNPITSSGLKPASSFKFSGYNFTAIGRNSARADYWSRALMISPVHFIWASHYGCPNGTVYNFNKNDGSLTTGTVLATRSGAFGDIGVGIMTAPVTGINPFRTISPNDFTRFKNIGTNLITVNQRAQVFDTYTTMLPTTATTLMVLSQPQLLNQLVLSTEQNNNLPSVNNDDSSSPFLLPYTNGELLLIGYAHYVGSPTGGETIFSTSCITSINNAMTALEQTAGFTYGYRLSTT